MRTAQTWLLWALGVTAFAAMVAPQAGAQSRDLEELRTTLELAFMCSVKNDTTPDVKDFFEVTRDKTLQREWNRAIERSQRQMKAAQQSGGQAAIRALQRYDLSCTLLDTASNLPIGLQSALHK